MKPKKTLEELESSFTTKSKSPSIPLPASAVGEAAWYLALRTLKDRLEDKVKLAGIALEQSARGAWLAHNRNQVDPLGTVKVSVPESDVAADFAEVLADKELVAAEELKTAASVTFYGSIVSKPELLPEALRVEVRDFELDDSAVSPEDFGTWIAAYRKLRSTYPSVTSEPVTLDTSALPAKEAAEFMTKLMDLQSKFTGLGIKIKKGFRPVENFSVIRHREMTPAQQSELETSGLKTKVAIKA